MSEYYQEDENGEDGTSPVELQRRILSKTKTDKTNTLLKKSNIY